jgi:hypothetical protein
VSTSRSEGSLASLLVGPAQASGHLCVLLCWRRRNGTRRAASLSGSSLYLYVPELVMGVYYNLYGKSTCLHRGGLIVNTCCTCWEEHSRAGAAWRC